jgi:hypothetical protein
MNDNYSWVENNYTVDNLGLTDCCLYLDVFIPPTIIQGIDTSQILKNYTYPDNNGFITGYTTTGCNVCLNPTPSPTTTPTPTPTPFPIYSWSFTTKSAAFLTNGEFNARNSSNVTIYSSCSIARLILNPNSITGPVTLLSSLSNGDLLSVSDPSTSKMREFSIIAVTVNGISGSYILQITPTNSNCLTSNNFDLVVGNTYNVKFFKR